MDISKMGSFGKVCGTSAEIFRQDATGGVKSGGTYWGKLGALFRSAKTEAVNNETRSQFLKALADTYGVEGYLSGSDGRLCFKSDFIEKLSKTLGAKVVDTLKLHKDFVFDADGHVTSGRPLTERRISAVNALVRAQASGARSVGLAVTNLGLDIMRVNGGVMLTKNGNQNSINFASRVLRLAENDLLKINSSTINSALREIKIESLKNLPNAKGLIEELPPYEHLKKDLRDESSDVAGKRNEWLNRLVNDVLVYFRALAAEGKAPAGMKDGMMSIHEYVTMTSESQQVAVDGLEKADR